MVWESCAVYKKVIIFSQEVFSAKSNTISTEDISVKIKVLHSNLWFLFMLNRHFTFLLLS